MIEPLVSFFHFSHTTTYSHTLLSLCLFERKPYLASFFLCPLRRLNPSCWIVALSSPALLLPVKACCLLCPSLFLHESRITTKGADSLLFVTSFATLSFSWSAVPTLYLLAFAVPLLYSFYLPFFPLPFWYGLICSYYGICSCYFVFDMDWYSARILVFLPSATIFLVFLIHALATCCNKKKKHKTKYLTQPNSGLLNWFGLYFSPNLTQLVCS